MATLSKTHRIIPAQVPGLPRPISCSHITETTFKGHITVAMSKEHVTEATSPRLRHRVYVPRTSH